MEGTSSEPMDVLLKAAAAADANATAAQNSPSRGAACADFLDSSSDESTAGDTFFTYTGGYAGKWSFDKRAREQAIAQEKRRRERWRQQTRAADEDDVEAIRREQDHAGRKRARPALERFVHETARKRYTSGWRSLVEMAGAANPCLTFADIPWPTLQPVHDAEALARVSTTEVEHVVIPNDTLNLAQRKRTLVNELRRWHPDKFTSRWGGSLGPGEAAAVLDGVKQVSQSLNELHSG